MSVPLVNASLAAFVVEAFLYGNFFVLSATSITLLCVRQAEIDKRNNGLSLKRNPLSVLRTPMFIGSIIIAVLVTAHWITNVVGLFNAFVHFDNGLDPKLYYADLARPTYVVRTCILCLTLAACDSMIIYRLWVIWNYSKRVVLFPILTVMAMAATGGVLTYELTKFTLTMNPFVTAAGTWITCQTVFSLVTNLYCTSFIAWRILSSTLASFIESAALYTIWLIVFGSVFWDESNMQTVFLNGIPSTAGVSFMLINVRVGLGWAQKATSDSTPRVSLPFITRSAGHTGTSAGMAIESRHSHEMGPVSSYDETNGRYGKPVSSYGRLSPSMRPTKVAVQISRVVDEQKDSVEDICGVAPMKQSSFA
ncbi:hypothetical protein FISHEDRAFT_56915 [Fistulina hepatica ATCC 64428]|nr:hypothetical protein FISHEDRAFT_56915 [Fistulina hepatica ATCC 64428]